VIGWAGEESCASGIRDEALYEETMWGWDGGGRGGCVREGRGLPPDYDREACSHAGLGSFSRLGDTPMMVMPPGFAALEGVSPAITAADAR
jgi:hypothetical protein